MSDPAATPAAGPTCRHCGSQALRRPHSRNGLERLVRKHTRWDRYACTGCGRRGWLRARVPEGAGLEARLGADGAPPAPLALGRPAEHRDLRASRQAALRLALTVAFALAAGTAVALLLQRVGGGAQ